MDHRHVAPPVFAAILALAGGLAPASARADDRAAAQQLFQQGKELVRAGDFAQACPKFEAAEQFSATPGVRLNLAECWVKLGRTASAWGKFDEALAMAERAGDTAAAEVARAGKTSLEPELVYLTVVVGDEARVPGLEVHRDGEKLPPAAWGVAIPVDPGTHDLSADAPGRKHWSETAAVAPRAKATVVVPTLALEATVVAGGQETGSPRRATQRILAWVSGGVGLAGIGVASYFAVDAISKKGDYRSHLNTTGQCADATCQTDSHAAYVAGNVATGGFVAGGALLAAGVVLFLTGPPPPHAATAQFLPLITPRIAGLGMTASW